jgi:hypothetical protein
MTKTTQGLINMRDEAVNDKKKILAFEQIVKEVVAENKKEKLANTMLQQELTHYKNKHDNKKVANKTSCNELTRLFEKKDEYIKNESTKGIDEMVKQLKKQYY